MKAFNVENRYKKSRFCALMFAAAFLLAFASFVFAGCGKKAEPLKLYQIKQAELENSDELALKTYDYENLSDTVVTMRADTMYVTERNIKRPEVKILPDTYTLTADKNDGTQYVNEFHFDKGYPTALPNHPITAAMFADKTNLGVTSEEYLKYYRYMLHSQGYRYMRDYEKASQDGTLTQNDIYKHPAIDACYGEVEGADNAVEKVIILDPSYRSYHATGLYLPAGEAVTVKIEGLQNGKQIVMQTGLQNSMAWRSGYNSGTINALGCSVQKYSDADDNYFFNTDIVAAAAAENPAAAIKAIQVHGHLAGDRYANRLPWIRSRFTFKENKEYTIGSIFGGLILLEPSNTYNEVKITIRGAVETPHYILGVTTPEYFDKYLRTAPGVYSILDTENGQLIGPSNYMRNVTVDEIDKLAMLWHSFFSVNETFTGGTFNRKNFVKFDYCVPAGAAVALGNYEYACPSSWYGSAMNYRGLINAGSWGILHEVGHNHGSAFGQIWGFGEPAEGEVRNNALTCLAYLKFLDVGTNRNENGGVNAEHGFVAHPYSNLSSTLSIDKGKADFSNYDYFQMLSMYVNIMHSFGVDKYYELLKSYKTVPQYVASNKRADFIYRCAQVYGLDFRTYFNVFYKANVSDAAFNDEQLAYMNKLESYQPVANLYAGGIDGVHTGGAYKVNFGQDVIFDLEGKTISTDGFTVVRVNQPSVGRLTQTEDGKWKYSFANKPYLSDEFTFVVKLNNGQNHILTVYMRISGNVSQITTYGGLAARDLTAARTEISGVTPVVTANAEAGVSDFTNSVNGKNDLRIAKFVFKAVQSGKHTFYFKGDDVSLLRGGTGFGSLEDKITLAHDVQTFKEENRFSVDLNSGESYCFEIWVLNSGGKGFGKLQYCVGEEAVANSKAIPSLQFFHPSLMGKTLPEPFVYEPTFMVSSKSGMSLGTLSSPKSDWSVLKAPLHQGGNEEKEELRDLDTGEVIQTIVTNKSRYLIDGQNGTVYHSAYSGKMDPMPHEYIIDTGVIQRFNFFSIATRNNVNSYIKEYELYVSSDTSNSDKPENKKWTLVSDGENLQAQYKNLVAKIEFPEIEGRYWRLVVKSSSGGNFTVIAELDTGISAEIQRVIPLTDSDLFTTKGWKDSRYYDSMQSGLIFAEKKNEKLVMRINGSGLSLYANKGQGYGSASVYIDGKNVGKIDLNAPESAQKRLVFSYNGLEDKEHTVEIITLANKQFNLCFAGMSYQAQLLNAPNIYKEKALAIALTVFVLLFAAVTVFVVLSFCLPKFRNALYGNRFMKKYDEKCEKKSARKKSAKKPDDGDGNGGSSAPQPDSAQPKPVKPQPEQNRQQPRPTARPAPQQTAPRPAQAAQSPRPAAKPAARPANGTQRPAARPNAGVTPRKPPNKK